ncbi:MAG: P27 family phage terminase small subunit [Muribaculaceae bacterium]|nr:P27 family phage terminase small subunit [Muribaculaceae bacterium]
MDAVLDNLVETDRLKSGDIVAIDILASALQSWRLSKLEELQYGITIINDRHNRVKNPAIDVGNASLRQAIGIMQDYGLTAMSRKKLERREKMDEEAEDDSPLANFFRNQLDNPG